MSTRVSTTFGKSTLLLETGKMAKQADGSVVVQQGDTMVLVTACASPTPITKVGIIPLTCDYREKFYAAGKIPGGFFKREGRPTEKEILSSRLMDRPIRPMIIPGFLHELQIMASVISADAVYDPDVLAVLGASAALRLSTVPFPESLGCVRVGYVDGQFVINPTFLELTTSSIDLVVAGTQRGILTIEAGLKEVPEQQLTDAIAFGYQHVKTLIAMQDELVQKAGRTKSSSYQVRTVKPEVMEQVKKAALPLLAKVNEPKKKLERHDAVADALKTITDQLTGEGKPITAEEVALAFETIDHDEARRVILEKQTRLDGRKFDEFREITCDIGVLPRTHGSALFTRGETQSLGVTTLGTSDDEGLIEALESETYKRFYLHYNFPPFSVNEVRPIRGTGRREIGHGALAERALLPMIPTKEEFPYTVRVVSDILESNGSSSMASVCSGSLSLMDAGVPIKAPVSGVAMGLITEGGRAAILTDISGTEDHIGDMDFKVTGTKLGTTAMQVDVKLSQGLTIELIGKILQQSHPARMQVLDIMAKAIDRPRADLSAYAPRITAFKINPEKIREVIGPGGRIIRQIIAETGAQIDIEDDGTVSVASSDGAKAQAAIEKIKMLTEDVQIGKIYNGKVKRIMNFGAFCEISPGKEGLVHVSELDDKYVSKVEDVVKIGDEFPVKVIEIDEQGRVNLSRKRAQPGYVERPDQPRPERSDRGDRGPRRGERSPSRS